jgi:hypothetical protein
MTAAHGPPQSSPRQVTPLVRRRRRAGRRRPEMTCTCDAVPWPHRAGSVAGCYGLAFCDHGLPTPDHPDWSGESCRECALWEWVDWVYDSRI